MIQRIQKNFPFIFILPSANVILLQVWAPSMHNLVDGLFILWDFVVYLGLGALTIALSANVIFSQSPIRSLFSLIGVFICAILLFLSIRVEFLSMIFLIVYIGAIAILFLFVIMLLNLKKAMPSGSRAFWANWANPVFFLFLSERGYVFLSSAVYVNSYYNSRSLAGHSNVGLSELNQINYYMRYGLSDASIFSDLFYSVHGFVFLATACVLAVSMIGSIILALSTAESYKIPETTISPKVSGLYFVLFISPATPDLAPVILLLAIFFVIFRYFFQLLSKRKLVKKKTHTLRQQILTLTKTSFLYNQLFFTHKKFYIQTFFIINAGPDDMITRIINEQGPDVVKKIITAPMGPSLRNYNYSDLYTDLTPTKMVIIIVGTVIFAYGVFIMAQKYLPIEDQEIKKTTSFLLSGLFAWSNFYLVLSQIEYNGYTLYNAVVFLSLLYVVGRSVISAPFRDYVLKLVTTAFASFVVAIENTIDLHFKTKPGYIRDCLFFLYYSVVATSIGAFLEMSYYRPNLWTNLFIFTVFCCARYLLEQKFRKDFTSQKFVASVFYLFIIFVLITAIATNTTFAAITLFFSIVLLCYLDGYGSMVEAMEHYKKAYQEALPKINELDPITRYRVKHINWAITVFPVFRSTYIDALLAGFAFSFFFKFAAYWSNKLENEYKTYPLEDSLTGFTDAALLYTELYFLLFSFPMVIAVQNLAWRFHKKDNTILHTLINLTSYDAVCGVVGNHPGRLGTEVVAKQAIKWTVYGTVTTFLGTVYVKAQTHLDLEVSKARTDAYDYRARKAKELSPTGELTTENNLQFRKEVAEEIPRRSLATAIIEGLGVRDRAYHRQEFGNRAAGRNNK